MTEGLQIPAAARILTGQSLSQPDGCQLPLHKGAEGAERMCGASPVALEVVVAFPPHPPRRWPSGAETELPWCVTAGNTASGEQSSPPSRQWEGIALRRCMISSEAGLAPSGSPTAQIPFHHTPFGWFFVLCKLFINAKAQKQGRSGCGTAWFDFVMSTCAAYVNRFRCRGHRSKRRTGRG